MIEDTLIRILSNRADEKEKQVFFASLENNPEQLEEYYRLKNLYVLGSLNKNSYPTQSGKSFNNFWNQVNPSKSKTLVNKWLQYAAVFVAATLLVFIADYLILSDKAGLVSQEIEYSSEKGSVSKIKLKDGSSIWLSSGTHLVISQSKKGKTVARLDGEAYFDLIPDPSRDFKVDLGHIQVKDIGTSFNIRAYSAEQTISTTLVQGRIQMQNSNGELLFTLQPGELMKYDKNMNKAQVVKQDPTIVTAWKDGKFVFIDQSLTEICEELENWYNVQISIEDPQLAQTHYTSVVKRSTTVEMVLKILSVTDQIKYEIIDKKEGKDIIKIKK